MLIPLSHLVHTFLAFFSCHWGRRLRNCSARYFEAEEIYELPTDGLKGVEIGNAA